MRVDVCLSPTTCIDGARVGHRTQRYHPGERRSNHPSRGLAALLDGGNSGGGRDGGGEGARSATGEVEGVAFDGGAAGKDGGGGGGAGVERRRHRHRQLLRREGDRGEEQEDAPRRSGAVRAGLALDGDYLLGSEGEERDRGLGEAARRLSSPSKSREGGLGSESGSGSQEGEWSGRGREGQLDVEIASSRAGLGSVGVGSGDDIWFDDDAARERRPRQGNERVESASTTMMAPKMITAAAEKELADGRSADETNRGSSSSSRDRSSDANDRPRQETDAVAAAAAAAAVEVVTAEKPSAAALDAARALAAAKPVAESPPTEETTAAAGAAAEPAGGATAAAAVEPGAKNTAERGAGLQPENRHHSSDGYHSHHHSSAEEEEVVGAEFFPLPTLTAMQQPSGKPCACARYIGEFGAAPVERGYWFQDDKV